MDKQFLLVLGVIIAALVGVFALTKEKADTPGNNVENSSQVGKRSVGAGTGGVTLTEYGDFECPACKAYYPLVKDIKQTYGDKIKFEFRHFPLTQIHRNAMLGSRAAEAANNQGKFFEMHDLLYENQDSWSKASNPTSVLESFAQQIGLNIEQFKTDMASEATLDIINADIKAGQNIDANSTPTFAINGKKVDKNPQTPEEFKKLIEDELAKNAPKPSGSLLLRPAILAAARN